MNAPQHEQGFTLIEVMISLGLFALIAVAGLGLVDSVLNVQGKTEERLDRLSDYQRAMYIVSSDLDQIARGPIAGGGGTISFTRSAAGFGGTPVPVQYDEQAGALMRMAGANPQTVLTGVANARWRFYDGGAWTDHWPPSEDRRGDRPQAVSLDMQVERGTLRRVVTLPARPDERP
ncbi:type II secretion system protein GspJ [Stakelama marina]|uniref:Type II secretion system protein J n=1 Tax=Stakelama marina TaxID=2826939 RepID=A0A8T4IA73_9SPHN|nr:type II secretion system protein GspJ [Stakelama marina]MBR0551032.1 prepilin-type N-terminal cleavage/methylation domain-containing protein [Stakelama marina]